MSLSTHPEQAEQLLRALWGNLDDAPGYLEVRPLYPDRPQVGSPEQARQASARRWWSLEDALPRLPGLFRWTARHGLSAYFGVLPRLAIRSGRAEDAAPGSVVWADLDTDPHEAKARIDGIPFAPSAVVLTGRGVHAYWILSEPSPPGECARLSKALAVRLDADRAVTHPAALLRLPGSWNPKRRRVALLAHLESRGGYHSEDLAEWLELDSEPKEANCHQAPPVLSPTELVLGRRFRDRCGVTLGADWRSAVSRLRAMPAGGYPDGEGRPEGVGRSVFTFHLGVRLGRAIRGHRSTVLDAATTAGLSADDAARHFDRGIQYGTGELGGGHVDPHHPNR